MRIYHGSEFIIKKPEYGKGKKYNDYGRGFYCTESMELAKEWSCDENHDGYANAYDFDMDKLKVLNLNAGGYNILHWITLLLQNRHFRVTGPIAKDAKDYLTENFFIDVSQYDVVIGYRADDSYFSFAEDFINNAVSVSRLSKAMRLGNLGEQIVLISENAFERISYAGAEKADKKIYYKLKSERDRKARKEYLNSDRKPSYGSDEIYIMDILRQGVKSDDPRLR